MWASDVARIHSKERRESYSDRTTQPSEPWSMKLIVDSNQLQSETLRTYLASSKSNVAVLTDYAAMEAHKGDTLASIYKSMAILCDFPWQVAVLKGTRFVSGLRGRKAGLQRRLIDEEQTATFSLYVADLRRAQAGHHGIQKQLVNLGREATSHLALMLTDAKTTGEVIEEIAALYSKEERASVRLGSASSDAFVDKTVRNVLHIAARLFREHPNARFTPAFSELPNTFIFRVALCTYLVALEWAAKGGARDAKPETFRNDFVDMNFAAYATYFDGLMSADAKVRHIHKKARVWLSALFGCELPSGWLGYEAPAGPVAATRPNSLT
jgi:hypothetical protein